MSLKDRYPGQTPPRPVRTAGGPHRVTPGCKLDTRWQVQPAYQDDEQVELDTWFAEACGRGKRMRVKKEAA